MRKRILSILLALCMVICLVPVSVLADDTALRSVSVQNIGPNEASIDTDLYEKMSAGINPIKLIADINLYGTLSISQEVIIDLNGHMLKMGDIGDGSVIKVNDGGHLTIIDSNPGAEHKFKVNGTDPWVLDETDGTETVRGGVIYGGKSEKGGGVCIEFGGEFTMTGGSIVGCTATDPGHNAYGGGVYVAGTFKMTGGNIVGCTVTATTMWDSARGGGVYVTGTFTMSGGSIIGCTAVGVGQNAIAWGGAIRSEGTIILSDKAEIRDCHATGNSVDGGGISAGGLLNISGDVQISGCTADGSSDAMSILYAESTISGGTFDGTVKNYGKITGGTFKKEVTNIDVGTITGGVFYGGITNQYGGKIDGLTVTYRVNKADYAVQVLQSGEKATKPTDPVTTAGYDFSGWFTSEGATYDFSAAVTVNLTLTGWLYVPVMNETELTTALADSSIDVVRLTSDIKLSNELQITNNRKVTLDLGGYVLDLGEKHISVFDLGNNLYHSNELTIMDSRPNEPHKFTDNDGLWKPDENGDKTVSGGIITGGSDGSSGGAITVGLRGTVTMNGGSIVGCYGYNCGGAVSARNSTFIMNGGSIIGCKTDFAGGAVYVLNGNFEMNGGSITDCVVTSPAGDGGAVYISTDSTFTMTTGGSIADCTAVNGSALYLKKGTMNADGGTVSGTVALESNSTIQGGGSTFSGLIINNSAQAQFGGAHSPLGIVGEEPIGANGYSYHKVTFDTDGGTMSHTTRYFLQGKDISNEIKPDPRTGYTFGGWYNGKDLWDHANNKVTGEMTLTAHWTACDHSGHTGEKPDCTTSVICTECGGTIAALGHNFSVQHNNDEHWNQCSRCYAIDGREPHDWDNGRVTIKPTCTTSGEKTYTCTDCGATKIELIQANGHSWNQEWQHDATHHWHSCSDCDEKLQYKQHTDGDKNHICDICKKTISNHKDENKDHKCDYCGKVISNHEDTDKNHVCDYCEKVISNHEDADKDHKCDYCGKVYSNHTDTDKNHICDYCGKTISNHEDTDKNHICDYCEKVISNHEDTDKDHKCDYCGKVYSNHEDADKNHICDYCEKVISNHEDTDKNHICDYCGKTISNHEDTDKNHICDYCEKVISNHEDTDKNHICDYCGKTISNHEDTDKNHICDYCEKVISNHEDADKDHKCDYCGKVYSNHTDADKNHICDYCGKVISNHEDTDKNHICDYCGKIITNHIGGKATCAEKAVCNTCGKAYGELDAANHADLKRIEAKAATEETEGNIEYWYCEGCGKYYAEAEAKTELTKAETATEKLPKKPEPTSPKTGDNSNILLWFALMFVSGGVFSSVKMFTDRKRKSEE